jgi:predicted oxidoreductase
LLKALFTPLSKIIIEPQQEIWRDSTIGPMFRAGEAREQPVSRIMKIMAMHLATGWKSRRLLVCAWFIVGHPCNALPIVGYAGIARFEPVLYEVLYKILYRKS